MSAVKDDTLASLWPVIVPALEVGQQLGRQTGDGGVVRFTVTKVNKDQTKVNVKFNDTDIVVKYRAYADITMVERLKRFFDYEAWEAWMLHEAPELLETVRERS